MYTKESRLKSDFSRLSLFIGHGGALVGISLAWFRRNKFRFQPSQRYASGPAYVVAGDHAIQTYPTTASERT